MKPIKLVMSAFGPYKDRVEINFDELGNNGIFLITGDTGSGKTTIFDAISFALFGVSSGSRRENNSLRSDFADNNIKTYVELEFFHKGVVYKIERVPRYMRKKLKGDGTTSVGGDATLSYMDEVITGDKNVSDKCIEILGINANQFKQIVMIAQGEFMELLLAKPKDRAVIFRKIFATDIYKDISDLLKEQYLSKRREYEDVIVSLNSYKKNMMWDVEVDDDISTDMLLELINDYNLKLKEEENKIKLEKEKLDEEYKIILNKINEGELINDSIISLEKLENELLDLNNKRSFYDEKEISLKKNKDIYDFLVPKRDKVNNLKKNLEVKEVAYVKNLSLMEEVNKSFLVILEKFNNLKNLENKKTELIKKRDLSNDKLNSLNEVRKFEEELKEKSNLLNLFIIKEKREILDKFKDLEELNKRKVQMENCFRDETLKFREMNEEYNKCYCEFLSHQAGILASNLRDNCPCPVCGSLEHPKKAILNSSVLSKEMIDEMKKRIDDFSKKLESKATDINNLKQEIAFLDKELINEDKGLVEVSLKELEVNVTNVNTKLELHDRDILEKEIISCKSFLLESSKRLGEIGTCEELREEIFKIDEEIKELELEIKRINDEYHKISLEKEKCNTLVVVLEEEIVKLKEELVLIKDEYAEKLKELGYVSEDDYLEVMLDRNDLVLLEQEVSSYQMRLVEINSSLKSLREFLKDKSRIDVVVLREQKVTLEDNISNKNVSLKELDNKLFNNLGVYGNIKNVYNKCNSLEQEVMVYKDLSDTANGSLSGKNKQEFEQYVQASYFDMVLASANKRFNYMTDERYLLARKEEALKVSDKLGLELEVLDGYTGKRRDIRTLSGGESFKAALSLALGMSDVIQEAAGGIVVDAMFIDEGFGSLDDNSLESAMNAIMMLSQNDKIIGIISHVNELKARIDKKIIVRKSNTGSSVEISC